ncbi:hypothetical protein [Fangia hongkongensis]|uniref:hypothetical protein n=1 Tax=Fangia hongkongensis TaxID=270495 RepID=UPI00037E056C|nr:hypothetical protein [Fangia hongkongensis]MBK2125714.1 hypothetical protein [Fangia hongkongensis]
MYNKLVLKWLLSIKEEDCLQRDKLKQALYVGGEGAEVYFDLSSSPAKFAVIGSAYLTAMVKWLQQVLLEDNKALQSYDFPALIDLFSLPSIKRKDALLLLELIEIIKDER